jgi:hypothetical protein
VDAAEVVEAERDAIVGGVPAAGVTVKRTKLDISVVVVLYTFDEPDCAEPGTCTAICTLPAVVRSEAGTGAVS